MTDKNPVIIFFGSDQFAADILDHFITNKIPIATVVTTSAKPSGRGLRVHTTPVADIADQHTIPCVMPDNIQSEAFYTEIARDEPDLSIVVSYGKILPSSLLYMPKRNTINIHPSLLPRWRGPSPVASALLSGDTKTGVTIIELTEKVDAGDILGQKEIEIDDVVDNITLHQKLAEMGASLCIELLPSILNGTCQRCVQDESLATYSHKRSKEDGSIDWTQPVRIVHDHIRGSVPWPGAYTFFRGKQVKIFTSSIVAQTSFDSPAKPGTIVRMEKHGPLFVATGTGILALTEMQLAGKKRMDAYAFCIGLRIKEGESFTEKP